MPARLRPASIARLVAVAALGAVLAPAAVLATPTDDATPGAGAAVRAQAQAVATTAPPRKVSGWLPDWASAAETATLAANGDLLDVASPFWYGANDTTKVTGYRDAGNRTTVRSLQAKGVLVLPTVEDDMDPARLVTILSSPAQRTQHVATLTSLATKNGFDGLDLDYEVMAGADPALRPRLRAGFSAMVNDLSLALHRKGLLLSVTVLPKQTDDPNLRAAVHDYAAIGKVADRVRVMAYDYSYPGGPSGPVAPLPWVNRVLTYTTSVVPKDKVQVGIPLYGYDWAGPDHKASRISQADALALLTRTGSVMQWDADRASSHFTYTDPAGVAHEVWYPDPRAVDAKIALVAQHGIRGASFFAFGHEDRGLWSALRDWSLGRPSPSGSGPLPPGATAPAPTATASVPPAPKKAKAAPKPPKGPVAPHR